MLAISSFLKHLVYRLPLVAALAGALSFNVFAGSATTDRALVNHGPVFNGGATIEGSVQQMQGEDVTLNGGAKITGDLLLPGTPELVTKGKPKFGGIVTGTGSTMPSGYSVVLNGNAELGRMLTRIDPSTLPSVRTVGNPLGSRTVTISKAGQSVGDSTTLRDLVLNGNTGQVSVPPGVYGEFTANGGSGFTLGVAGATQPAVYEFQRLTLNGQARIEVLGRVIIRLASSLSANGNLGSAVNPSWLRIEVGSGGVTVNGGCTIFGNVIATNPTGAVVINGNSCLTGGVSCDRLTLNGNGSLKLRAIDWDGENRPPMAQGQNISTQEDQPLQITLAGTDPEMESLTFSIASQPGHGTIEVPDLQNSSLVVYTPAANYSGTDSFTFKANDGSLDSEPATVEIVVAPINDAPTAIGQSLSTPEEKPLAVTLAGVDVDGDTLSFRIVRAPQHGTLSGTGALFTYEPSLNYNGPDSFEYVANDGLADSNAAVISIEVGPENDAPVAEARFVSTAEDTPVAVTLSGTDADGDPLVFTLLSQPRNGALSGTAPNLTYSPAPNYNGNDTFSFRVNDGKVDSNVVEVPITISAVNDAPSAVAVSGTTDESVALSIPLSGADVDGDPLSFEIATPPAHGFVEISGSTAVYIPAPEYDGMDQFTYVGRDPSGLGSVPAAVTIEVKMVNTPPEVSAGVDMKLSYLSSAVLTGTLAGKVTDDGDPAGGTLTSTWSKVSGPGEVSFAQSSSAETTVTFNAFGAYVLKLTANDGALGAEDEVQVTVERINEPPQANSQDLTATEDNDLPIVLSGTDEIGAPLSFSLVDQPAHGSLSGTGANWTYQPSPNFNGTDRFSFKVNDGEFDSSPAEVRITVAPVNDAPTAIAVSGITDEGVALSIPVSGADVDGDPLSFEIATPPAHGSVEISGSTAVYVPAPEYDGMDQFTYLSRDPSGLGSVPAAVTVEVKMVNTPPEVSAGPDIKLSYLAGAVLTGTLAGKVTDDGDPAGGTLTSTWSKVSGPGEVSFAQTGGVEATVTFSTFGTYVLRLTANDGALTAEDEVQVTVERINEPPKANSQELTVAEDSDLPGVLSGTDEIGAPLTFTLVELPAHGSLSGTGANWIYYPAANFNGADRFSFKVNDGEFDSSPAEVRITVTPINDAPVAISVSGTTNESTPLQVPLQGADVDGDALTFEIAAGPQHGVVGIDAGIATYTPTFEYDGADQFSFVARDPSGAVSASAQVSISVLMQNSAPVVSAGPDAVVSSPDAIQLTGTVTDDGDPGNVPLSVLWAKVSGPGDVTFADATSASTTASYTLPGEYVLRLTASDGEFTSSDEMSFTAKKPNQAPTADATVLKAKEDSSASVTLSGSDPDGDTLSFEIAVSPVHGSASISGSTLEYTPQQGYFGNDQLQVKAFDGKLYSEPVLVSVTVDPKPRWRKYTADSDFAEGRLSSMLLKGLDELSLNSQWGSFNYLWVPLTKGTVVRIDTRTGEIKGEYRTAPTNEGTNPSRTSIDKNGCVWVGNRGNNSVVQIATPESGLWIDKNGNGKLDTSIGLGDLKGWLKTDGTAGGCSLAEDELIINYVKTSTASVRHVSVVPDSNLVWIGGQDCLWNLIDGQTGQVVRTEPTYGNGYGGVVDRSGVLWSGPYRLFRWDTSRSTKDPTSWSYTESVGVYGVTLAPDDSIWTGNYWNSSISRFSPSGALIGKYKTRGYGPRGVAVDPYGNVWVAHSQSNTVGHFLQDGTWIGDVRVGSGPYAVSIDARGCVWAVHYNGGFPMRINPDLGPIGGDGKTPVGEVDFSGPNLFGTSYSYTDMIGSTTVNSSAEHGSWSFVFDGVIPSATWGPVTWNADVCEDASIQIHTATSEDGVTFGPFEQLDLTSPIPKGAGRYLAVEVKLKRATTGQSPILYDLTVGTADYPSETLSADWSVEAGEDRELQLPLNGRLQGSICSNGQITIPAETSVKWSKVSGPGAVTFANANAKETEVTISAEGTYVLRFEANVGGVTRQDDVTIYAVPINRSPWVHAGRDLALPEINKPYLIKGIARDDGLPNGSTLTVKWKTLFTPAGGAVTIANDTVGETAMTFTKPGLYVLELSATDGELSYSDQLEVRVGLLCTIKEPSELVQWWPGNGNPREWVRGNDFVMSPQVKFVPAKVSAGILFDGTNANAKAYAHPSLDIGAGKTGFAISFWAKASRTGRLFEWMQLGSTQSYFECDTATGALRAKLLDENGVYQTGEVPGVFSTTEFRHVGFVYERSSGDAYVYVNGNLKGVFTLGSHSFVTSGDFHVVGSQNAPARFGGVLDEVSLYNVPVASDLIWEEFTLDIGGKCPFDGNGAPSVEAGSSIYLRDTSAPVTLNGSVTDDGEPEYGTLRSKWTVIGGTSNVVFADPALPNSAVSFSKPGIYVLKLTADDSEIEVSDTVEVHVDAACSYDTDDSLVGWWRGDDRGRDATGRNHGQFIGNVSGTTGVVGAAYWLNGSSSIRVPASPDLDLAKSDGYTVEFWTNRGAYGAHDILSYWDDRGAGFGMAVEGYVQDGGSFRVSMGDARSYTINGFPSDAWIHMAVTYDKATGTLRIYRNGILTRQELNVSPLLGTDRDLYLGGNPSTAARFRGALDEVSIYHRALNPDEVASIYMAAAVGKCLPGTNSAPQVNAGRDTGVPSTSQELRLQGSVTDDGEPEGYLWKQWYAVQVPQTGATVTFADASNPLTTATFSQPGIYVLELWASDGLTASKDQIRVQVGTPCELCSDPALVAWWPGERSARDAVGENHGVLARGTYASGKVGSAFMFDRTAYVRVPASADLNLAAADGYTVEFWMKRESGGDAELLSFWSEAGRGFAIEQWNSNGSVKVFAGDAVISDSGFWGGWWTHLAVTYDGATKTLRVYRDGNLVSQVVGTNPMIGTDRDLYLGGNPHTLRKYFGMLDEVSIYHRALNPDEVASIYMAGAVGKCMPGTNSAPQVYAGEDTGVPSTRQALRLQGSVTDDGEPEGYLWKQWYAVQVPQAGATVTFADASDPLTTATFSHPGIYVLELWASDGLVASKDQIRVQVGAPCELCSDPALIAWWPGEHSAADVMGSNDGVLANGTYGSGAVGSGFLLNGTSYIRVPASGELNLAAANGYTVEYWSRNDKGSELESLAYWNEAGIGFAIHQTTGVCYVISGTNSYAGSSAWLQGQWVHTAVTYDKATKALRIYRDGMLVKEYLNVEPPVGMDRDLYIGGNPASLVKWKGMLDEVSIYHRALNPDEVASIYMAGAVGKCMPGTNSAPQVNAGEDTGMPSTSQELRLQGSVTDDGEPEGYLWKQWYAVQVPQTGATVTFADASDPLTTAAFSHPGIYVLELWASDGLVASKDQIRVQVGAPCELCSDPALIAWWPGEHSAADIVGNNDGVLANGTYSGGIVGNGFKLSGAGYVRVPASGELNLAAADGFTVEFWTNRGAYGFHEILGYWDERGAGFGVSVGGYASDGGSFGVSMGDTRAYSIKGFPSDAWIHMAVTYDKATGTLRIYRNGILALQELNVSPPVATDRDLYLGGNASTAAKFVGTLDEISIYHRALNLDEVASVYMVGAVGKCMPGTNSAPQVNAGEDTGVPSTSQELRLQGSVTDDGEPEGYLWEQWYAVQVPQAGATVTFADVSDPLTTATFSHPGIYVLELWASDGLVASKDQIRVQVGVPCELCSDPALIAWWPGEHSAADVVGTNDGVLANGTYAAGMVGSGFKLAGNGYVRVPAAGDLNLAMADGYTVEFWMKRDVSGNFELLSYWNEAGRGFAIEQWSTNGSLNVYSSAANVMATSGGWGSAWIHAAITYDKATKVLRVYRDGSLVTQVNDVSIPIITDRDLYLGGNPSTAAKFRGTLDEVSIYHRALNPDEVASIYMTGAVGKCLVEANSAPRVDAGYDLSISSTSEPAKMHGYVVDDGRPIGAQVSTAWIKRGGPGNVIFVDGTNPRTQVFFDAPGYYEVELFASDGMANSRDTVDVRVGSNCSLEADPAIVAWWPGNSTYEDIIADHDMAAYKAPFAPAKVGSGFRLSGTGYLRIPFSGSTDIGKGDAFTVEGWINPDPGTKVRPLMQWTNGVATLDGLSVTYDGANNRLAVTWRNGGTPVTFYSATKSVMPSTFTHFGLTFAKNTGIASIFLNGTLAVQQNVGAASPITSLDCYVGGYATTADKFTGTVDELTYFSRALSQSELTEIYLTGSIGKCHPAPPNSAPVVSAGPDQTVPLLDSTVLLQGAVQDDELPAGSVVTVTWIQVSGPATATIQSPTAVQTNVSFSRSGLYEFKISATDGDLIAEDTVRVQVLPPPNEAPVVNAGADRLILAGANATLTATATDDGYPEDSTVQYLWKQVSGPGTVLFSSTSTLTTVATPDQPGSYVIQFTASDGDKSSSDSLELRVGQAPQVQIVSPANNSVVASGQTITVASSVSDPDGTVVRVRYFDNGTLLGESTAAPFSLANITPADGVHTLTATAEDNDGFTRDSAVVRFWAGSGTVPPPVAAITSPGDRDPIAEPTSYVGTASSPMLVSYQLQYRRMAESCNGWVTFASGTEPVTDGTLGILDPTLLLNGIYQVRLLATDALARTTVDLMESVVVEGGMKVGHFSMAFEDLTIPLSGLPITVTREYDSRKSCAGDFGPGWELDFNSVKLEKSHRIGDPWAMDYIYGGYVLQDNGPHTITVTFPNGETLKFLPIWAMQGYDAQFSILDQFGNTIGQAMFPIGSNQPLKVVYQSLPGNKGATLKAKGYRAIDLWTGSGVDVAADAPLYISTPGMTGDQEMAIHENSAQDSPLINDATGFILTLQDGSTYEFDAKGKLVKKTDRAGNTLTFTRDGIFHSNGTGVSFLRDSKDRITAITDPRGNSVQYSYNAQGQLEAFFDRTKNPTAGDAPSSSFAYTPGTNFLTDVFDGKGIRAVKNYYDDQGRLWKTVDAAGKETVFTHEVSGRTETITSRDGKVTVHQYDEGGNIVRTQAPDGTVTASSYHVWSDGKKSDLKEVESVTGLFTNEQGQLITKTVTTRYQYEDDDPETPAADDGLLRKLTDPLGNVTTFTYDGNGNVLTVTDAKANASGTAKPTVVNTYYPGNGKLHITTDVAGNTTEYTYDAQGNPDLETKTVTVTDSAGATTTVTLTTDYDYNAKGQLERLTDANGHVSSYEYDENGNRTFDRTTRSATAEDGSVTIVPVVTENEYDAQDRLVKTWDAEHPRASHPVPASETVYDDNGKVWKTYDALRNVSENIYNSRGELEKSIAPNSTFSQTLYDAEGRREWSIDQRGKRTKYVYDDAGRLSETWFCDAGTTPLTRLSHTDYDSAGRVWKSTDAEGNVTTHVYDDAGRRRNVIDAKGKASRSDYDANGNLRFFTDALNRVTEHVYDDLNRRVKTIFPASRVDVNEDGTIDSGEEAVITETVTDYDELGRRINEYEQSPASRPLAQRGYKRFVYDNLGRLTDVVVAGRAGKTPNAPLVTSYTYDELGNQLTQTDAENRTTRYIYDNAGRRTRRVLPLGQIERSQYDDAGRLRYRTDFNGKTTEYQYDVMGRLEHRIPDPSLGEVTVSFTYTATGQRETMLDATGLTTYQYDNRNRLEHKITPFGTLTYSYYESGLLKSISSGNAEGAAMSYTYDVLNRLEYVFEGASTAAAENRIATYGYDDIGNLQGVGYANGITGSYGYTALNRLENLSVTGLNSGAQPLMNYTYATMAGGQRSSAEEHYAFTAESDSTRTVRYAYDGYWRLQDEAISSVWPQHATGEIAYTHDKVGNRLTRTSTVAGVISQGFTYDANDRLNGDTWDNNGNTVTASSSQPLNPSTPQPGVRGTDSYDSENHLTARTGGNGSGVTLVYDGDGNRVGETVTKDGLTTSTTYLVDTQNPTGYSQILEEQTNGQVTRVYLFGHDLIAQDTRTTTGASATWQRLWYGYDGHGNTRFLTNDTGAVVEAYDYEAFGQLLKAWNPTTPQSSLATPRTQFLYCGELYDQSLGLYHLRARLMNPLTGRFWTMDNDEGVCREPKSLHKYLYACSDPVNQLDPAGNFTVMEIAKVAAVVATVGVVAYSAYRVLWKGFAKPLLLQFESKPIDEQQLKEATVQMERLAVWSENDKFRILKDGVQSDIYIVRVFEKGHGGGSHNMAAQRQLFISDMAIDEGPLATALVIFAEFQHDGDGGALNERDAQTEFEKVRNSIPPQERTPYINRLNHGY